MAVVDLSFVLQGNIIPVDHGYPLFSAISKILPDLHNDVTVGVHPITGRYMGDRQMAIIKSSRLTFRLPVDRIPTVINLAGKVLNIGGQDVRVGVPHSCALIPGTKLYSRLVIIKGFMEPRSFMEAAQRQADALGIKGQIQLIEQPQIAKGNEADTSGTHSPFLRRTIRIHNKEVVGFAVRVQGLTDEDSLALQEHGLGGRRRFGCGVFIPDRR